MKIPIMEKQGKYFITPESEPLLVTMLSEDRNMILLESNIMELEGAKNQVVLKNCVCRNVGCAVGSYYNPGHSINDTKG